jgi:prepilin-type N-terminal cleavage/methylation domain-containing protein
VTRRAGANPDAGVTLIELSITVMLLGIVLAMVVQVMISLQSSVELEVGRSTRNDRLRLALDTLERQVRSGEVVADPASESDAAHGIVANMSARIRTNVNGSSGTDYRCVQWRIAGTRLESRRWSPNWRVDADVTGWQLVAEGIVNNTISPAVSAFALATDPAYGGRVLEVRLVGRGDRSETREQRVETAITARNAVEGTHSTECDDLPAYP